MRARAASSTKGQTALEFTVLLGFMLFVFTAFFYVMQERSSTIAAQGRHAELRTVGDIILTEVTTANRVRDGYSRTFELPASINAGAYTVRIVQDSEVIINTTDEEYLIFLPANVSAVPTTLQSGRNIITKSNGVITIKPAP